MNIEKQNVVRNDAVMATDEISFFWGGSWDLFADPEIAHLLAIEAILT
jgi:hypothetical protein